MNQKTYPVDNSAILYLALMRRRHTNTYRFTMTMTDPLDPAALQQAADRVFRRFPTIIAGFRPGFFRYTVVPADRPPQVNPDPGCLLTMTPREIRTCACRIFYRERDISLEAFHALTDGYGAVAFLTTMTAEYLRIRNQARIPVGCTLRSLEEEPEDRELEDAYLIHQQGRPLHLPSRYAYQLPGGNPDFRVYPCARSYPTEAVLKAARSLGVSMTSLLSGIMASSIMEVQSRHTQNLKPVRIMVPVDLRRMFGSTTLRNFILYALPTMEPADRRLPLRELLSRFQTQMKEQLDPKRMASIMAYNVRTQASLLFRCIPRAWKCAAMRIAYRFFGESNSSITLTNLGNVTLPDEMAPHVQGIRCILTPRAGSPYNCAVIALGGRLTITLSRFCHQPELETVFFAKLNEVLETA